jgi:RNA polymerase sigma factor (sigma-70 family)
MSVEPAFLFRSIEQLLQQGSVAGLDERSLLERFATHRDGRALAVLLATHGPMVLGVCRRFLREPQDVEDAFQSTFLVLVRRAGSIRDPRRVGAWLHGVARRVALRARGQARKRAADGLDRLASLEDPAPRPELSAERAELLSLIDEELDRLPERYRDVLVLCDLEGRSYTEAAQRLRCPLGTIQSRLARGRKRLRWRLARKGIDSATSAAWLADFEPSIVPRPLLEATLQFCEAAWKGTTIPAIGIGLVEWSGILTGTACRRIAAAVVLAVVLGASFAGFGFGNRSVQAPEPLLAARPQTPEPVAVVKHDRDRTVLLEIRSAVENKPLPGAAVWVRVTGGNSRPPAMGRTNGAGQYAIDLGAATISTLQVVAAAAGHVPKAIRWHGDNLPEHPVMGLERGLRMGGKVVDERGRPIEGARVLPGYEVTDGDEVAAAITDAQGVWHSDALPPSAIEGKQARPIELRVSHPDHVTTIEYGVSAGAARAGTVVLTMKQGISIAGSVLGPAARPVPGASVVIEQTIGRRCLNRTVTDTSGQFHFGHWVDPESRSIILTAKLPGLAAAVRKVTVTPSIPRQTIQLSYTKPLRGRVVDSQGKPVAGACVASNETFEDGMLEWSALTDDQGRFQWPDAQTSGSIVLDADKSGFEQALGRQFEASNRDITLTMHRPLHLHGTVTDVDTGQPVDHFDLIPGWGPHSPGGRVEWLRGPSGRQLGNGRFDLRGGLFPDQGFNRSIRIEAEGYLPAELIGFRDDAEEITHDFKLHEAVPIKGVIRGPDGRPLADADVALSNSDNYARVKNGRLMFDLTVGTATHMKTGPDGRYSFRPQERPVAIVVAHVAGFGVRSPDPLAASFDVTLVPWGRIEGVLMIGKNFATNQKVSAWLNKHSFDGRVDYDTKTDARGRFVFERVTPGAITVYRYVDTPDHRGWIPSNPVFVDVNPGQTVRVEVGGSGRSVIGKLAIPQGFRLSDLVCGFSKLSTIRHKPRQPDDYPDYSREQQDAWYESFFKTAEGKKFHQDERAYAVDLGDEGAFRIEDVPAGQYVLTLPFRGRTSSDESELLALAQRDVTVPTMSGGRNDEPLDLGTTRLDVFRLHNLRVGDLVPAITRNAADGRPLDLGALRGKFVLLDFWQTFRKESLADIPALKDTYEAFSRDSRFAMIGLSLDTEPDAPRRYAAYRKLAWEQRYLGTRGDLPDPVAAAFGVEGVPQVLLIGPDGRLVAKDLKGPEIKQAVARALVPNK